MAITADFELGTSGNTIAAADPGSATAWNTVVVGADDTLTYDTAHAAHGSNAAKFALGATASSTYMNWAAAFPDQADHYGRFYLYFTANPSAALGVFQASISLTRETRIDVNANGTLRMLDNPATTTITSTNAIALNQWVRVEYHIIHNAATGIMEFKLFNTPDSATPTETVTSGNCNTGAQAADVQFGGVAAFAIASTYWMDDIVAGAASYPGPVASTASTPDTWFLTRGLPAYR